MEGLKEELKEKAPALPSKEELKELGEELKELAPSEEDLEGLAGLALLAQVFVTPLSPRDFYHHPHS